MPAYHSAFNDPSCIPQTVGNMALLPLRTTFKGPAPKATGDAEDIIDEALNYFKANIFFRNYEIKGAADRSLIYATLYISECLKKLAKCGSKTAGQKELTTLALSQALPIPGESGFPLNAMFKAPRDRAEEDAMRAFLLQLRQETGVRLLDRVFADAAAPPSKWWLCFTRKRFIDKALVPPGVSA